MMISLAVFPILMASGSAGSGDDAGELALPDFGANVRPTSDTIIVQRYVEIQRATDVSEDNWEGGELKLWVTNTLFKDYGPLWQGYEKETR